MLNNSRKRWTKEEDILLISSYGVITYNQIGKKIGRTNDAVEKRIRVLEREGKISSNKLYESRKKRFIKKFETMYPGFIYYSGYKNVDKPFRSKCKSCGFIQERSGQCTRPKFAGTSLTCDKCNEIKRTENEIQREKERAEKEEHNIKARLVKILNTRIDNLEREKLLKKICNRCNEPFIANAITNIHCDTCLLILRQEFEYNESLWKDKRIECKECGKEFEMRTRRSNYCSHKCMSRATNRNKEIKRRKQIKRNGKIDYDISLTKLTMKDERKCKICGSLIDEQDYEIDERGNFVVGKLYPSIDHIIPISKGGTHTWNNVQLAHHHCNTIKDNNIFKKMEPNGQLRVI